MPNFLISPGGDCPDYPMCEPQPVQLDCRKDGCVSHQGVSCINQSPAITLNEDDTWKCWSYKPKCSG